MGFQWQSLLCLAEKVASEGGATLRVVPDFRAGSYDEASLREARLRCAISRSYYAAYHVTLDWWNSNYPTDKVPESQSHFALIERLGRRDEWRDVGDTLWELRLYRVEADYNIRVKNLGRKATISVALANTPLNQIGGLEP